MIERALRGGVLFVLLLATTSCLSSYYDASAMFRFEGRIVDEQGAPISGVAIVFVDSGLEEPGSRAGREAVVAHSDADGEVVAEYFYSWGGVDKVFLGRWPMEGDPLVFDVRYSHETFGNVERRFSLGSLERREQVYVVRVGAVIERDSAGQAKISSGGR